MKAGVEETLRPYETRSGGERSRRWLESIPWRGEGDAELVSERRRAARHGADGIEVRHSAYEMVDTACETLSVSREDLNGGGRTGEPATARGVVASVLRERWGVPRGELARALGRNPEVVSHWVAEARERQGAEPGFAERLGGLDRAIRARLGLDSGG